MKRLRKNAFAGDPRAAETRELMKKALVDDEVEVIDLQASELACDVADAWFRAKSYGGITGPRLPVPLSDALDRLELVTRPSAMRKVRP